MTSATTFAPLSDRARGGSYRVTPHPGHPRLRRVALERSVVRAFLDACADVDPQHLVYVPFMRFVVARRLDECAGGGLGDALRALVRDRATGGFTVDAAGATDDADDFVKLATAIGHLLGPANFDAMSGTYYARFAVEHTDASDSYLRQAYHDLTLHTDGTHVDEPTDWLLMMKIAERHARGGKSRLLHLDDWDELAAYAEHPLASHAFTYVPPKSKNVSQPVQRPTFTAVDGRPCLSFIDQFVYPETIAEATYLHDLSASLERSPRVVAVALAVGEMIVLDNLFWAHGRAAFEPDPLLHRALLRQRGRFAPR